jgi:amidohydrolase
MLRTKTNLLLSLIFIFQFSACYAKEKIDENYKLELKNFVQAHIQNNYEYLEAFYEDLHSHPEVSFSEKETSKKIAHELTNLGFEVTQNIGGYGVVGILHNGHGPTIMLRTDMDALPVKEQTGLSYASKVFIKDNTGQEVGVMHACGHDMHMSIFVGTARVLKEMKPNWQGTLMLVAQPAEEKGAGAKKMLEENLYGRFGRPDYAIALHVDATLPAGSIGITDGYAMANVDDVDIQVRGIGGHGAYPHNTKDPIVLAAQIILGLQTIISREIPAGEPAVISVGSIQGGTKNNIIPSDVNLQLTVRSYTDEIREKLLDSIKRVSEGLALSAGLDKEHLPIVKVDEIYTPAVYNDAKLTSTISELVKSWLGDDKLVRKKPSMAGEDFGRYGKTVEKVPICLFWLGAVDGAKYAESKKTGKPLPSLHSDLFAPVPSKTLKTGITTMSALVLNLAPNKI